MSRTDFRAAVSPERLLSANPHQFRWTLSLSSRGSVLSLPYSRGDPAYPPPEMVTQMVIWEESGPTVIHPGTYGTRGWWQQSPSQRRKIDGTVSLL